MKVKNLLKITAREEREQNTPLLCLPKTYVGLEYEWENTSAFPYQSNPALDDPRAPIVYGLKGYFAYHVDGSLRDGGMEFTFKEPYSGTRIISAIEAMDEASRAYGFTASYRTSLHCHLDMSELNYPKDAHRFAALYALIEPLLYKFVGSNRDGCNYCLPWYANPHHYINYARILRPFKNDLYKNLQYEDGLRLGAELNLSRGSHKYAGLNLMSLGQFGTVEFRQAPVNMPKDKILTWINIIMRLKKYVIDYPFEPAGLLQKMKLCGAKDFIFQVFDTQATSLIRNVKNLDQDLKTGSLTLFHFLSAIQ